jgi:serine protease inhibitor ecotin
MKQISTLFFLLIMFALVTTTAKAQNKIGKISGIAKTSNDKALEGATVILLKAKDSSWLKLQLQIKQDTLKLKE